MNKMPPCFGLFMLAVGFLLAAGCSVRLPKPNVVSGPTASSPTASSNCVDDCETMAQLDEEADDSTIDVDEDIDDLELEMDMEDMDMETDGRD